MALQIDAESNPNPRLFIPTVTSSPVEVKHVYALHLEGSHAAMVMSVIVRYLHE